MIEILLTHKSSLSALLWHGVVVDIPEYIHLFDFLGKVELQRERWHVALKKRPNIEGVCVVSDRFPFVSVDGVVTVLNLNFFVRWHFIPQNHGSEVRLFVRVSQLTHWLQPVILKQCERIIRTLEGRGFHKLYELRKS